MQGNLHGLDLRQLVQQFVGARAHDADLLVQQFARPHTAAGLSEPVEARLQIGYAFVGLRQFAVAVKQFLLEVAAVVLEIGGLLFVAFAVGAQRFFGGLQTVPVAAFIGNVADGRQLRLYLRLYLRMDLRLHLHLPSGVLRGVLRTGGRLLRGK